MDLRAYTVVRKVDETPNCVSIFLKSQDGKPLETFHAGQHLSFDIGDAQKRDYILSSFSAKPSIYRITVSHGGDHHPSVGAKYWVKDVAEGDVVRGAGPHGDFHLPASRVRPLVVISRHIGEVAAIAIAEELAVTSPQHPVVFLHSTYNSSTFALKTKLRSLKADLPNMTWRVWFSSPRQSDRAGKEFDLKGEIDLKRHAKFFPADPFDAYICGPTDFVNKTVTLLRELNTNCENISAANMGDAITPPLEAIQERELPPLEPRKVRFARSGIEAIWSIERGTLLEFAESLGIEASFNCRTGMCGKCAQKISSGQVCKIRDTSAEIPAEYELLCSNVPVTDVEIDL